VPRTRAGAPVLLGALALILVTEALLRTAPLARRPLTLDVGPSTGAYLSGFGESEERPPSTFRWTEPRATVAAPLTTAGGPATLVVRAARFVDTPARIHASLAGQPVATLLATPGGYRIQRLPVTVPPGPFRLDLLADDPQLGLAVDWVRVEGVGWRAPVRLLGAPALVVGTFLILVWTGLPWRPAMGVGLLLAFAEASWAALDPFAFVHVMARLAWPALGLTLLVAVLVRSRPGSPAVALAFLAGELLKGAALFHPSYFYNDVRNNRRYVEALATAEGSLQERNARAQVQVGVAYPRWVAGKKHALPYSPLFFLPFAGLSPDRMIETMKHVAVAAAAAEALLAFLMGRALAGTTVGVAAAAVDVLLPPLYNRLLLAMWSTTVGHLLDVTVIALALRLATRTPRPRDWLAYGLAVLAACLTYISSLFNLGLFSAVYGALERRRALRLVLVWMAAATVTVTLLYSGFVVTFVREILPALRAGVRSPAVAEAAPTGPLAALSRIPTFYGYGFPALTVAGLFLFRRRAEKAACRVLVAYALAFLGLVVLRASGGLFKDLKEIEFAAPLVALGTGLSLVALAERDRAGRWAAALVAAGLVAFSASRYVEYVSTFTALAGL
jgi:hypothetical protein